MNLRTGVDLIEIARVAEAVSAHGDRFLERVFTPAELAYCRGRRESLAARFAAKEAVAKALGTGIWRQGVTWTDVEILSNPESGAPVLHLHGAAAALAQAQGLTVWSLSLSHDRSRAIAFVTAIGFD
ncbi:MAG: holo-ACP synthase [Caldilineaceae bacterium]|nr:holo-ACP synthase [Caldilineaceae bacterium]MBP8107547.1 holo-ACP synthase [Caldilineaceae bacterium]MBP8122475.1 holo-ACP synthase [Caldilineaceae bacterium]